MRWKRERDGLEKRSMVNLGKFRGKLRQKNRKRRRRRKEINLPSNLNRTEYKG